MLANLFARVGHDDSGSMAGRFDAYLAKYNPRVLARQSTDLLDTIAVGGMCNMLTRSNCLLGGDGILDSITRSSGGFLLHGASPQYKITLGLIASFVEAGLRPIHEGDNDDYEE